MENMVSHRQTSTHSNFENESKPESVKQTIVEMVKAMQADYGRAFTNQFSDPNVLADYKNRLLTKIRGFPVSAIIAGYEIASSASPKFCPTVPEIANCISEVVKQQKDKEKMLLEANRVAALPPPNIITCDPIAMLKDVMDAMEAENAELTAEQKQEKRRALMLKHDALIAKKIKQSQRTEATCAVISCGKPGVFNNKMTGSNFYCAQHFQRMGD
jgi:hypothetical protein